MSLSAYDLDKESAAETTDCSTKGTPIAGCSADHRVRNNILISGSDTSDDCGARLYQQAVGTQNRLMELQHRDSSIRNTGHEFTNVLSDAERSAVIEC